MIFHIPQWACLSIQLKLFTLSILFFHLTELLLVLIIQPEQFSRSSLLLSKSYIVAMLAALVECAMGWMLVPQKKAALSAISLPVGAVMIVMGELLRKAAWLTAKRSFTHLIQVQKRKEHQLVTHGVYSWSRHPGYVGWSLWAIGTQFLLANPLSLLLFTIVIWAFFKRRIPYEELHLKHMFGEKYELYAEAVATRIPGIA